MPIKGYIIEKYNAMTNAYTCNRLVQEASALDMDLQIVGIHDTTVSMQGVINHGKILEPVDFVINRYKWGREKDAINALATRSYNPLTAYNIYINKFEQVRRLHSEAFLIPKYLLGTSLLPFSSIVEQLGLPFVGKGLESSMGEEIVCIRDKASYEELSLKPFIQGMALRRIYLGKLRQRSAILQHPRRSRCLYAAQIPGGFPCKCSSGSVGRALPCHVPHPYHSRRYLRADRTGFSGN